jgi:hypothetical protein
MVNYIDGVILIPLYRCSLNFCVKFSVFVLLHRRWQVNAYGGFEREATFTEG